MRSPKRSRSRAKLMSVWRSAFQLFEELELTRHQISNRAEESVSLQIAKPSRLKTLRLRHRENFSRIWVFDLAARRIATHVDIFGWVGGTEDEAGFVRHSLGCGKLRI